MTSPRARRALLSVSDKSGIVELARALAGLGFELISTGGTARTLAGAGLPTTEVTALTGFPEIMDGRVKTLHPRIHGGLLGRAGTDDAVMREHGIRPIDVVVVNLYPFAQTISRKGCTDAEAIENIDVGGPAMLRAAAKNHERVTVLVAPADYEPVLQELRSGDVSDATRKKLAGRAFAHTAAYDSMVSAWLRTRRGDETMPDVLSVAFHKKQELRYGENPHQRAAFYADPSSAGASIATTSQLQGKELSYNNIADADTALECVRQFAAAACVIVKHANPCGVAVAAGPPDAYLLAYEADPVSAFGGIIAFNLPVDARTAKAILERQFVEVIVAPDYDDDALRALAARQNVRVLRTGALDVSGAPALDLKSVSGGLLAQTHDDGVADARSFRQVTRRAPDEAEIADLLFAWKVCKFVKSNAIVLARGGRTIGIGPGQTSRVVSTRVAAMKAEDARLAVPGSVMASDAFFPFRDGLDAAAKLGVRAVIQPGGSVRDAEVVAAADEHGIAMVFTGVRHFRH